jgi:hypothetical protein
LALKPIEVIADRHGQRQELLQRLVRIIELYSDPASFQTNTGRQVGQFLIHYRDRGFHQKLGPFNPLFPQLLNNGGYLPTALHFTKAVITLCEAPQPDNQLIAIGEPVASNAVLDRGSHDLLGAAPTDAQ